MLKTTVLRNCVSPSTLQKRPTADYVKTPDNPKHPIIRVLINNGSPPRDLLLATYQRLKLGNFTNQLILLLAYNVEMCTYCWRIKYIAHSQ